jgi:predicted RecA/RadA family phage recombinase
MKNMRFQTGDQLSVPCTQPATPVSGDPVLFGDLPGVALTDERADGETTVKFSGVPDLDVKGENFNGTAKANVAVAVGDVLFYNAADTPKINKDNRGTRYGVAMAAVASGATTTIPVRIG